MSSRVTLFVIAIAVLSLSLIALNPEFSSASAPPFVVNSVADTVDANPGNDICADVGGDCSLRAAIQEANAAAEVHEIHFGAPACAFTCTFEPATPLPTLSRNNVRIDGLTHPSYNGSAQVKIFGTSAGGGADGLTLTGSGIDVAGLAIFDFSGNGITISGGSDYLIEKNTIGNHGAVGVFVNASNAALISNSITGNQTGIYTLGPGHSAHFNRIRSNDTGAFDDGPIEFLDAENNWWGCNEGPNLDNCDTMGGPIDADPWLVLDFEASPDSIPGGGTSDLTASLTHNSDNVDMSGVGLVPNGIPVSFDTDLGSVGSSFVVKSTTDGMAQVTLTADEGPGVANLLASVDSASVADTVTITSAPPSPTPAPTPLELLWGDVDCDGTVDLGDAIKIGLDGIGSDVIQGEGCPGIDDPIVVLFDSDIVRGWGDVDCDGEVDLGDAIKIGLEGIGSDVDQTLPCPLIDSEVILTT